MAATATNSIDAQIEGFIHKILVCIVYDMKVFLCNGKAKTLIPQTFDRLSPFFCVVSSVLQLECHFFGGGIRLCDCSSAEHRSHKSCSIERTNE